MRNHSATGRRLFVEPFLTDFDAPRAEPPFRYDEARDLTVLDDGTPVVAARLTAGTGTDTRVSGEQSDADEPALSVVASTMTRTAIRAESADTDNPVAWGGTELSTRRIPSDIEKD